MASAPEKPLRLAVVADIHHGPDSGGKKGSRALDLLRGFLDSPWALEADALVDLGDRINNQDPAADEARLAEVADILRPLPGPRVHLLGNHDLVHLSREDNARILDAPASSHVLPMRGFDLVVWQADTRCYWRERTEAEEEDLCWLEDTLANGSRPAVVLSHFALTPHVLAGNPYFDARPGHDRYLQQERIRSILAARGRVVLCLAGHLHANCWGVADSIVHLAQQSLTESFATAPEPAGAFGLLEITPGPDARLSWTVHGRDRLALDLPLPRLAARAQGG
ncbi:metallophosphoesterase [Desulfovibrio sp. X2]|uniref:metallophosphoesterase family protein n=1 Tax=Desulfovibrio sp. X2 TaxID=941449 RepID=UPI000358A398|nr:metallophosphoesterase [Desulfovibrio sp. X2]EPR43830.1 metallophosphoesterase [Desulfovibrio sp. X2]